MSKLGLIFTSLLALAVSVICAVLSFQASAEVYQRDGPGQVLVIWSAAIAITWAVSRLVAWNAERMRRAAEGPHETVMLTHKGWFGIVPVYLAEAGEDGAALEPRYRMPLVLLEAQAAIFNFIGTTGGFPIKVTGKLATPKAFKFKVPGDPVMAS